MRELRRLIERVADQRFATGIALLGCRGVGKSVLLRRLGDLSRSRNFLTIQLGLSPRLVEDQFLLAIRRGIADETGRLELNLRLRRNRFRWRASGRVMGSGIDLEPERIRLPDEMARAVDRIFSVMDGRGTAALFIIDEADFLTPDVADITLVEVLGRAAELDVPISAVVAGTGRGVLRSLAGQRSFGANLIGAHLVRRLDKTESGHLLVETANTASQNWSEYDLTEVIDASLGVPRYLQVAGSSIFRMIQDRQPPSNAIKDAAKRIRMARQSLIAQMDTDETIAIRHIETTLSSGPANMEDIAHDLSQDGVLATRDRAFEVMTGLEAKGLIEVGLDGLIIGVLV